MCARSILYAVCTHTRSRKLVQGTSDYTGIEYPRNPRSLRLSRPRPRPRHSARQPVDTKNGFRVRFRLRQIVGRRGHLFKRYMYNI